jgi:hypothetical protein
MKTIRPNHFGSFSLDQCRKITVRELFLEAKRKIPDMMRSIYPEGELVATSCHYGGQRHWFMCQKCRRRCGTLYEHPITLGHACRKCTGLSYAKQRFKGMVEEKLQIR